MAEQTVTNYESLNNGVTAPFIQTFSGGGDPILEVSAVKSVAVRIVLSNEMFVCPFWIGIFTDGDETAQKLFDTEELSELLFQAARKGINEAEPLMLSDSSKVPARFVYLLPKPNADDKEVDAWIKNLVSTVQSWAPKRVGIYLAPELLKRSNAENLLLLVLKELIATSDALEYFLLPGSYGTNAVLNAAVKLKFEMEKEKVAVYVFH